MKLPDDALSVFALGRLSALREYIRGGHVLGGTYDCPACTPIQAAPCLLCMNAGSIRVEKVDNYFRISTSDL